MATQDSRFKRIELAIAVGANVLALGALVLVYVQTLETSRQTKTANAALHASNVAAEMQFNEQVMERLDDV